MQLDSIPRVDNISTDHEIASETNMSSAKLSLAPAGGTPADNVTAASADDAPSAKQSKRRRGSITAQEGKRSDSVVSALTRSLLGVVALFFRAPIRLYRPIKLSSWNILETLAKREGKALNLRYMRLLIKREKASFLPHLLGPPLLMNTLIGFSLFESFTLMEAHLLNRYYPDRPGPQRDSGGRKIPQWSPLWVVGISGGVAGAAQCIISAPLDNVRIVLAARPTTSHGSHSHHQPTTRISWRSIFRAALLPFAPEMSRKRLVDQVKTDTPTERWALIKALLGISTQSAETVAAAKQRREHWQAQLKRWRGGVHGAGLVLSLARDSVGFSCFFVMFEISRRTAYAASVGLDSIYGLFSSAPTLPPGTVLSGAEDGDTVQIEDMRTDDSWKASRSVSGRLLAAFILVIGGAVGAAAYEIVGRPAELMRTVIWEGRKAWEGGRLRSRRHVAANVTARPAGGHGRPVIKGARAGRNMSSILKHRTRKEPFIELRRGHTGGTLTTRIAGLCGIRGAPHFRRPDPMKRPPSSAIPHVQNAQRMRKRMRARAGRFTPTLRNRPGAIQLLKQHALRTSTLRLLSGSPPARLNPTPVPMPFLLLHTYFVAPFFPYEPEAYGQSHAPSAAQTPESVVRRRWTLNNPVKLSAMPNQGKAPGSIKKHPTAWGAGRFGWVLRRLATPYGIGFVAFAYLGGDLAS